MPAMRDVSKNAGNGIGGPLKPIRVLMVAPSFHPAHLHGGSTVVNLAIASELTRREDVELTVLTTTGGRAGRESRDVTPYGWRRHAAGFCIRWCRTAVAGCWSWEMLFALPGRMLRADCIHLVATFSWNVPTVLVLALLLRKLVVWMPHGAIQEVMIQQSRPRLKLVWLGALRLLARGLSMRAIVSSDIEFEAFQKLFPETEAIVISHGVNIPKQMPAWSPDSEGRLRLIVLSRLAPQKGIDRLLRALPKVRARWRLDIHGEGTELARLMALADELGLSDRVRFHGISTSDTHRAVFSDADLLVLQSLWEAFGMVVPEALGHGVPVLASRASPWSVLEKEDLGFWREATPEMLAAAIDEAADRDLRSMGERARQWVERNLEWRIAADKELGVIRNLLGHCT